MVKLDDKERAALIKSLESAYMEVFPTATIEERLSVLKPNSYVAVTCSPTKGINETLDMSERLVKRGFKIVPHVAAKMVRDDAHLAEIMSRIKHLGVDSLFVPGGDAKVPAGKFSTAYELLREIAEYDHNLVDIGIAAHPEGHPDVDDDVLLAELLKKQQVSTYLVTQMCFEVAAIRSWLGKIRDMGITLPAWIGLPGVADRKSLLATSLRIGVGDSLRFLRKQSKVATTMMFRSKTYTPAELLYDLAPELADPACNIAGHHLYCFNQVERTDTWRYEFLDTLRAG
jgi:methylenetetrahydrofolate reductase (NADPH)